jgi:hypothetical protein
MKLKSPDNIFNLKIILCLLLLGLIYLVNIYQFVYLVTPWQNFGATTFVPKEILDFNLKTGAWIGYVEPETGNVFTCKEAIVFLEAEDQKIYRCCNSPEKNSCVRSTSQSFSSDEKCARQLMNIFNLPDQLSGTRDYRVLGYCPHSGNPSVTIVQISGDGEILWKSIDTLELDLINVALKYFFGPVIAMLGWVALRKHSGQWNLIRKK